MDLFYEEQQAAMEEAGQSDEAIQIAMEWTKKTFLDTRNLCGFFWRNDIHINFDNLYAEEST